MRRGEVEAVDEEEGGKRYGLRMDGRDGVGGDGEAGDEGGEGGGYGEGDGGGYGSSDRIPGSKPKSGPRSASSSSFAAS